MLFVDVESFCPRLSAIRRHKDAAFFVGSKSMTKRAHVNDVGILRVDDDCRNVFRVFESHVLPGLTAVG